MPRRIKICKEEGCKNVQTTKGFCRIHYLRKWKTIKTEETRKAAVRLNRYVEGICKKNPDRYIDEIKGNIKSDSFDGAPGGEPASEDELDGVLQEMGYAPEGSLDKIVGRLRIDKDF